MSDKHALVGRRIRGKYAVPNPDYRCTGESRYLDKSVEGVCVDVHYDAAYMFLWIVDDEHRIRRLNHVYCVVVPPELTGPLR